MAYDRSAEMKKLWATKWAGRIASEETRKKISEANRLRWQDPEAKRIGLAKTILNPAFKAKRYANREWWHEKQRGSHPSDDVRAKQKKSANKRWDQLDRHNEQKDLCWSLKSPNGIVYQFHGLCHFVRKNPHLFNPEDIVWFGVGRNKKPMCRALECLKSLSPRRKVVIKETLGGWTWHINNNPIALLP